MDNDMKRLTATAGGGEFDEREHPRNEKGEFTENGDKQKNLENTLTKHSEYGILNKKMNNNKGIDIQIDEFTNCLRERATGKVLDTEVVPIKIKPSDYSGWKFDWSNEQKENDVNIYALRIKGSDAIQGLVSTKVDKATKGVYVSLVENAPQNFGSKGKYEGVGGHLFAEAIKQSYNAGYNGFVYFTVKTNLITYYSQKLGACKATNTSMFIDEEAAGKLYEQYYGGVKL